MFKKSKNYVNFSKRAKGFTILEVVIAIFFLTIGIGAAFGVIQKILGFSSINNSRLIAANLSQEGIEIVKNIRDTNYIEGKIWDDEIGGEIGESKDYEADYNDGNLSDYNGEYLKIDAVNGFYNYDAGANTKFKRKIIISEKTDLDGDEQADRMKITVITEWDEKSGTNSFEACEYLYDWK